MFYFLRVLINLLFFTVCSNHILGQTKIITTGDEWQYFDTEVEPPKGWEKYSTLTDNWKKGISPLGYGSSIIVTNISFGDDPESKHITKYFKKTFIVDDPYAHLIYKLNVQRDDGIVVYLNGREIMRDNMPDGEIINTTTASSLIFTSTTEKIAHTKLLSPDDFNEGINTISASVHQARKISSDCIFNLELIGGSSSEMIPLLFKEQAIKNLNLNIKLKEVNHKLDIEKKDLQFQQLEQSKNIIKTSLLVVSLLLLLATICLIYFWISFINKEKRLKEITQNKDREMMNVSLNLLNNQQFLKELKRDIENNIKEDVSTIKKELKRTITRIDYNLDHEDDWENLKKHFNSVHIGYVDKLIKMHPSLTDIELRHCIFIKLHMQTKEIANILHIDPRSVQASRYRLKKKMNLDENTDLKEYLLKF